MFEQVVQARAVGGGIEAQLNHYDWPTAGESVVSTPHHRLTLSLTELPAQSRVRLGGIKQFASAGPILFLPADVPLVGTCAGGAQRSLACVVSDDRFASLAGRSMPWTEADLALVVDLPQELFRPAMLRVAGELATPSFASGAAIESLVVLLVVDLLRYLGHDQAVDPGRLAKGGLTSHQLRRLEERIADEDAALPSVAELAMELGMSSRHLLRGYRRVTGVTLQLHLRRVGEKRALHLVRDTDLPLKVVAQRLGFELQGSFSTAFRNAHGMTPSELRRRRE